MTTFDKREEAFETAFAHEQEVLFKTKARRDMELATWAARKMQQPAGPYREQILELSLGQGRDEAVVRQIGADLRAAGQTVSDTEIRTEMERLMAEAVATVKSA